MSSALRLITPTFKAAAKQPWAVRLSSTSSHSNGSHMPFSYANKRAFTIKYLSFVGLGFAIPWVAIGLHWYRPGGILNP
ncbi:hypothetical protein FISHEDRAFT_76025 [Fistulina hepatica ATCC 64428]|uniref:Cytochrome c oxidase subunit 8, mitochondrial n=1 Tax=Fistulina hepatica ATCC 64428 TaxID=1128425 RepID=A0A0D7A5T0_9AGAR|nr:hypothetical protein FISHEDRAFT_76025 [Fistulina hepatica ATCC 64428]